MQQDSTGSGFLTRIQHVFACVTLAVISFASGTAPAAAQTVITTAAGRDWVLNAEGRQAANVPLSTAIRQIATDAQGNLYIPDRLNHVVFRVDTDGVAHVFAGNGIAGFSGDGGAAANASLNGPYAVAIGPNGDVYVSDLYNYRVRKVDAKGIITTVAGSGNNGFFGDGGQALEAWLGGVWCLAVDSTGALLVCDSTNNRIRKISSAGIISTIAGNGRQAYAGDGGSALLASLNQPQGLLTDSSGRVYIAEYGSSAVRRISANGVISTIAGTGARGFTGDGGPANAARLSEPQGLLLDGSGNLFIGDSSNSRVRMVSPSGVITTVVGSGDFGYSGDNGPPLQASFRFIFGLAWDASGRLLVADGGNARVRSISLGNIVQPVAGNGLFRFTPDGTPGRESFLFEPHGVAIDPSGSLYIADTLNSVVRKVTPDGISRTIAGNGIDSYGPDAVPATQAGLSIPMGLGFFSNGELIIADRNTGLVHRVASDGVIHVVAGTLGTFSGFSGDGGPATQAVLNLPRAVAADSSDNLYIADEGNHRIRKVSKGVITTFAGNGTAASNGDGQSAALASLNTPTGVAVDASGNVYIGEFFGYRIRKVTPAGIISTFAGTGESGSSGDGGPAMSARLGNVYALAFDAQGNLYFSEAYSAKVRRITPAGTITTVAGSGQTGYLGDGGPATGAALNIPNGLAIARDGTLYIADSGNNRIRAVRATNVTVSYSISQMSFNVTSRGSRSLPQVIRVSSSSTGYPFSAQVSGGSWLSVTPQSGGLPADLEVTVDPSDLNAGTYSANLTIQTPGANPAVRLVTVTATVAAAISGKLGVGRQPISLSITQGTGSAGAQLGVSNQGGGAIRFTAAAATTTGGAWLQVSPGSGTVTATSPVSLNVTATPGTLGPGTYNGTITVSSADTAESITVPVTLSINAALKKILLSQTGLTFVAVAQGGTPLGQSFGILNTGQGSMNWTAQASTLSGTPGWLRIDRSSGTVATPYTDVSQVNVSVNAAGLAAGDYYGQLRVIAAGAPNSPQSISVLLTVMPPGSNPGPDVQPTGLIFLGQPGASPGSQNVLVSNPSSSPLTFGSSRTTIPSGGNWFVHVPTDATVQPSAPTQIVVQPDYSKLTPGVLRGYLNMGFTDGTSRAVAILTVVAPPGINGAKSGDRAAGGCTPTRLEVQPTSLTDPSANVGLLQPATVQARVVDVPCGTPVTSVNGAVVASFSNEDPEVKLVHVGGGNWSGTWQPRNGAQQRVTLFFRAFAVDSQTRVGGEARLTVSLRPGGSTPQTFGAANAASGIGTFISPGGLVSIYGQQLADQAGQPGGLPFPTEINGTQVFLAGQPLPLRYVGSGQVNAQVPFELAPNTPVQLLVQRGSTLSVPQEVVVAEAQPGVYTQDQSGKGAGVIASGSTNQLITPGNPARVGDVVVIYCNGLGAVNPPVPSGTPAPAGGPLSWTVNPLTATIGGLPAKVSFSGLVPGYPDLYQVNVEVPAVTPGNQVPVVLTIAGQSSPPVTMAVR